MLWMVLFVLIMPSISLAEYQNPTVTANRVVAAQTAKQTWREKYAVYLAAKDSGVVAIAADLATLKADIETTYRAGFLTE